MSWKPLEKYSDIVQAEQAGTPILVEVYDDAGTLNSVPMYIGARYRIATELINVLCTVVGIDHGARYPLKLQYQTEYGDNLLDVFSPDEILRVYPL